MPVPFFLPIEDAVDRGGTASDDVGIDHHEGQSSVTFERIGAGEGANALFFVVGEPMVAGDAGIVFIDFAEALCPVVVFAGGDGDPANEAMSRELGFVAPFADEVDDLIADVMGRPLLF